MKHFGFFILLGFISFSSYGQEKCVDLFSVQNIDVLSSKTEFEIHTKIEALVNMMVQIDQRNFETENQLKRAQEDFSKELTKIAQINSKYVIEFKKLYLEKQSRLKTNAYNKMTEKSKEQSIKKEVVKSYEIFDPREVLAIQNKGPVGSADLSSDSKYILVRTITPNLIKLTEIATGKVILNDEHSYRINRTPFSWDGKYVITASDKDLKVTEVVSGRVLLNISNSSSIRVANFSPDGKYIVTALEDGNLKIIEVLTGNVKLHIKKFNWFFSKKIPIVSASFSPDGKYIVTALEDGKINIYDTVTGKKVLVLPEQNSVFSANFSPDGKYIITTSNKIVRVTELATTKKVLEILRAHSKAEANFSPDGKYLVTSTDDHTEKIFEISTGNAVLELPHNFYFTDANFSPDGKYIITSADYDRNGAIIFNIVNKTEEFFIPHRNSVWAAQFSADGRYIVTGSRDGEVKVFELFRKIDEIQN